MHDVACEFARTAMRSKDAQIQLARTSLSLSCLVLSLVLQNVIAMHARKVLWRSIQDKFYKSKSSSHFPNFDASNASQMGHNSQQGFYLGQELLLDFAPWIDLTSNANNSLISKQRSKLQNTFCFFKTC